MSSGLMLVLAAMPGIPAFPFIIMSALTGYLGYQTIQSRKKIEIEKEEAKKLAIEKTPVAEEPISKALAIDTIRVELGYGLLPLVNNPEKGKLTEQIKGLRRQLAEDMGYILPAVRIQDNLQLPANTYTVRIKEIEVGRGDVRGVIAPERAQQIIVVMHGALLPR